MSKVDSHHSIIKVHDVVTRFGAHTVHDGVSFSVVSGTIAALIGGSGSGKSTVLKEIIGLLRPTAGHVFLFGHDVWETDSDEMTEFRNRFGVLFQNGALFSSLTVGENIAVPLREQSDVPEKLILSLVQLRLAFVGLSSDTSQKMPSELSGGMRKRVALARALVLEPEILFLDEPTSGLDPINARAFDALVKMLSKNLGLTIFMVTHDLDTLCSIVDQLIVIDGGKVLASGDVSSVAKTKHPWIESYFSARRELR